MNTANIQKSVEDLGDQVRPQIEKAKKQIGQLNNRVTGFIQDHPAACLIGALALGFLVARLARRQS